VRSIPLKVEKHAKHWNVEKDIAACDTTTPLARTIGSAGLVNGVRSVMSYRFPA